MGIAALPPLQKAESCSGCGCRYEVRHVSGGGQRSPPRGGFDLTAENQQLLVDEPDEDAMIAGTSGTKTLALMTFLLQCACSRLQCGADFGAKEVEL